MPMKPSDRIVAPARGSAEQALLFSGINNPETGTYIPRPITVQDYIFEVYRLAPLVGIDPAIVVAQGAHETGDWTSKWWRDRLNPAGIGITGDPAQNAASRTWENGTDAARAQIVHLAGYAIPMSSMAWNTGKLGQYIRLDPRLSAIPLRWQGTQETIHDLTGKWATDPRYAEKIAAKGNLIFPGLPDQEEGPMIVDVHLVDRGSRHLTVNDAWITVHNNGNLRSNRYDERAFVANGGGKDGVLYHFAVDATGVTQIMPLWKRGVHAGNTEGNQESIAIEMCVGSEPWAKVKENTSQLLAMLVRRDGGIDLSGAADVRFALDRVMEHRDWVGANPSCPARLIAEDGGAGKVIARAREILAAPTGAVYPEGMDRDLAERWFGPRFNPNGPVSQWWLANGKATGRWPGLMSIETYDARTYYSFTDGTILWKPNNDAPIRLLGT